MHFDVRGLLIMAVISVFFWQEAAGEDEWNGLCECVSSGSSLHGNSVDRAGYCGVGFGQALRKPRKMK
jgi:hypothetical protein